MAQNRILIVNRTDKTIVYENIEYPEDLEIFMTCVKNNIHTFLIAGIHCSLELKPYYTSTIIEIFDEYLLVDNKVVISNE